MRNYIILIAVFFFLIQSGMSYAQVLAGSVPLGTSIVYPNIILKDATPGGSEMDSVDLDCDGIKETVFELYYGNPSLDFCHAFNLFVRDSSIEICADSGSMFMPKIPLYNYGDTLCSGDYIWRNNGQYHIGWGAGLCFPYRDLEIEKYIGFRKFQSTAWIKVSFDLSGGIDTVSATIHEFLALCDYAEIRDYSSDKFFNISPNPSVDGKIRLKADRRISKIEITNAFGQVVNSLSGDHLTMTLPETSGLYILRVIDSKGNYQAEKVWRH